MRGEPIRLRTTAVSNWLETMRSIPLNSVLFAVIAAAAALGTILPQDKPPDFYTQRWGRLGWLILALQLDRIYSAPWFAGLLAWMALNVVLCKLWRMPWNLRRPDRPISPSSLEKHPAKQEWDLPAAPEKAAEDLERRLEEVRGQRFRWRWVAAGPELHLFAERGNLWHWGDWIAHVCLVVLLLGAALRVLLGFQQELDIPVGQSGHLDRRPEIHVFVKDFRVRHYPGTQTPLEFRSDLRIEERGRTMYEGPLRVNEPVHLSGVRFYQATYGITGQKLRRATLEVLPRKGRPVRLSFTEEERTARFGPYTFQLMAHMPDFVFPAALPTGEQGVPLGPAVHVIVTAGDRRIGPRWVFRAASDRSPFEAPKGLPSVFSPLVDENTGIRLVSYEPGEPVYFTGIQATYDPGVPLIWFGGGFLVVGILMLTASSREVMQARLVPTEAGTRVIAAGDPAALRCLLSS